MMKNTLKPKARCSRSVGVGLFMAASNASGQALVEAALVLPFFLLMILGALETGSIAYNAIEVENAAEAGALYGSMNRANAANTTAIETAATNDASNMLSVTATATTSCACQTQAGAITAGPGSCTGTIVTGCANPSSVVEWVNVVTAAKVTPMFQLPGLPATLPLSGNATMRVAPN
jgi:Flp pilus assembly protein TadG